MALIEFNPGDPEDRPLVKFIDNQLHVLGVGIVTSLTGSPYRKIGNGKSYSGMAINEQVDKTFNIDKVAFTPREYADGLFRIDQDIERGGGHFGYGQCLMLDECQLIADASQWQGVVNRSVSYTFSTNRNMRMNCTVVTPTFSWIDKHIRNLVSLWGYPQLFIENGKKTVDLHMYRLFTDYEGERLFRAKLRFYDTANRRVAIAKKFRMHLPSPELVEAYEKKATTFKARFRKDMLDQIAKFEEATGGKKKKPFEIYMAEYQKIIANPILRKQLEDNGRLSVSHLRPHLEETSADLSALAAFTNQLWKNSASTNPKD